MNRLIYVPENNAKIPLSDYRILQVITLYSHLDVVILLHEFMTSDNSNNLYYQKA